MKTIQEVFDKHSDKLTGTGWAVVYTYDKVILDKFPQFPNQANKIEVETIREVRFFNPHGELKVWRYNGTLADRYRDDSEPNIYKDMMNLWGNRVNDKVLIQEGRGIKLTLPITIRPNQLPLKVHVNNYYEFDEDGLIIFKDARLVKITDRQDEEV